MSCPIKRAGSFVNTSNARIKRGKVVEQPFGAISGSKRTFSLLPFAFDAMTNKKALKKARIKPKNLNPRHCIKLPQTLVKPHQIKPTSLSGSESSPCQIKPKIQAKFKPIKLRVEVG